jgi:hypothetical protein
MRPVLISIKAPLPTSKPLKAIRVELKKRLLTAR